MLSPAVRYSIRRIVPVAAAALAATWLVLLVGASYAASHAVLDGMAFRGAGVVYVASRQLCHQRAERSFHLWGIQMPVCARCTGLYAGAFLGSAFAVAWPRRRRQPASSAAWRRRLIGAAVPTAVSVAVEWAGLAGPHLHFGSFDVPTMWVRAVLALPLGFVVAWFVGVSFPSKREAGGLP